jgi:hypothetical protein
MAAPNIVNVANIYGKTAVQAVPTTATAIITNAGASATVVKVNALYVSNLDTSASYKLTVDLYRSSVAYNIMYQVSIPAGSAMDVLSKAIYLEEGDTLRLTADTVSKLQAVASYEVIS